MPIQPAIGGFVEQEPLPRRERRLILQVHRVVGPEPVGGDAVVGVRDGIVEDDYFASSLHVIHSPKYVQEDKVDAYIEAVTLDGIGSTHEEPGCLRFDVYQDVNDPTGFYLYEVYANPDAFEYHKGTPHISKWVETVKDWYDTSRDGGARVGRNVWPPDNWAWASGKPGW